MTRRVFFALALFALPLLLLAAAAEGTSGALDAGFGRLGTVTTTIGASSAIAAIALQPDRKIVAAGYSYNGSRNVFALARYNADGSFDPSFGNGGTVTTAIGSSNDSAEAVALQPDGKIVAAGRSDNGSQNVFALVRYDADGSLDTTFGNGGKVTTAIGPREDDAAAVALQPDGQIL